MAVSEPTSREQILHNLPSHFFFPLLFFWSLLCCCAGSVCFVLLEAARCTSLDAGAPSYTSAGELSLCHVNRWPFLLPAAQAAPSGSAPAWILSSRLTPKQSSHQGSAWTKYIQHKDSDFWSQLFSVAFAASLSCSGVLYLTEYIRCCLTSLKIQCVKVFKEARYLKILCVRFGLQFGISKFEWLRRQNSGSCSGSSSSLQIMPSASQRFRLSRKQLAATMKTWS